MFVNGKDSKNIITGSSLCCSVMAGFGIENVVSFMSTLSKFHDVSEGLQYIGIQHLLRG